ncbi:hypothetical protein PV08_10283 [Exophiala spinifera]|uniref:Peptidase A1 domain-containing protein n=1 Tax=Exophiala spinifera TaxID=91928 RepID=A0A0D2BHZ9_9EURO|nr:uncharacterized protein PV08_10283 [Exophiala spinifera]KIW10984.1 hypothetical protein PV08_10283 [Exophiala spinifera]
MKHLILLSGIFTLVLAKSIIFDFWKERPVHRPSLSRRSNDDFSNPLYGDYEKVQYYVNVTIGTPGQRVALQLDTGSSDTWVPSVDAESCADDGCSDFGAFDKNTSSTYHLIEDQVGMFGIMYADGTYASGDYFTDVLSFGENITLKDTTMALANDTVLTEGLMGIGFRSNEASLENDEPFSFPTVPEQLKNQGYIDRVAYSLYLDSYEDNTGSILFGGIDSSKHIGELLALPLSKDDEGNYTEFLVALTQISIHDGKSTRSLTRPTFNTPALLDSGTTDSYLPKKVFDALSDGLGATEDQGSGYAYVPCAYRKSNVSVIYTFGGKDGVNVSVPLSELISEQIDDDSAYENGTPACALNFNPTDDQNGIILGDSFLRSAYVVYDLENKVIALGQAKLGGKSAANSAAITDIPKGTALPGVSRTATVTAAQATSSLDDSPSSSSSSSLSLGAIGTPTFSLPGVSLTAVASPTGTAASAAKGASKDNGAVLVGVSKSTCVMAVLAFVMCML